MTFDQCLSLLFFVGSWAACAFNWWIVKPLLAEMKEWAAKQEAAREVCDGDEWKYGGDDQ